MRYEILDADGNVINTIEADEAFCSAHYERYRTLPDAPVIETVRNISGVSYLLRFTQKQRIAIRERAKTDPIALDLIHILDSTIAQNGVVNLLDQETVAGAHYLAAVLPEVAINPLEILA